MLPEFIEHGFLSGGSGSVVGLSPLSDQVESLEIVAAGHRLLELVPLGPQRGCDCPLALYLLFEVLVLLLV